MMVVKKYGEAISQERIVGNGCLKKSFLHVSWQIRPKPERCVAQQQLKFPGQVIHMPPLGFGLVVRLENISEASDMSADQPMALSSAPARQSELAFPSDRKLVRPLHQ